MSCTHSRLHSLKKHRETSKESKTSSTETKENRGNGKVRDRVKTEHRSHSGGKSKHVKKLAKLYSKLAKMVEEDKEDHEDKIMSIGKLYSQYLKILEESDKHLEKEERDYRSKIGGFFDFFVEANARAYLENRRRVAKALNSIEGFIGKEMPLLLQAMPKLALPRPALHFDQAVNVLIDFAQILISRLRNPSSHETALQTPAPRLPDLHGLHSYDSIASSNLDKMNDLNKIYDDSGQKRSGLHRSQLDGEDRHQNTSKGNNPHVNTPNTSKMAYPSPTGPEDYEYSETSKKKPVGMRKPSAPGVGLLPLDNLNPRRTLEEPSCLDLHARPSPCLRIKKALHKTETYLYENRGNKLG